MPNFGYSFTCPNGHEEIQAIDAEQLRASLEEPFGHHRICQTCRAEFDLPDEYWQQGKQWLKEQDDAAEDSN